MAIDTKRVRERRNRAKSQRGGSDLWKVPEGTTKVFLHGSTRPDDKHPELEGGINWIEVQLHDRLQMCLNPKNNPILTHPELIKLLKEKKTPVVLSKKTVCPTCAKLERGELKGDQASKNTLRIQSLWSFTPMWFMRLGGSEFQRVPFEPVIYLAGNTIFDDITEQLAQLSPGDPCDPNAATLMNIERVGTTFSTTDYKVRADIETIRKPLKLDKAQRGIVAEATKPGGRCDLLKIVANWVKTPAEMEASLAGVPVAEDDGGAPAGTQKECFGEKYEDDAECNACADVEECKQLCSGGSAASEEEPEGDSDGESENDANEEPGGEEEPEGDGEQENADDLPSCWGQWEDDDAGCKECDLGEKCRKETPEPEEEKPEAPAGDPSVDEIDKEAERVASQSRRGKAGKGKKK